MEFKVTRLCKTCACILEVDIDELQKRFTDLDIHPLENPASLETVIREDKWAVMVENVVSGQVCAVLCLDHELAKNINSWHYEKSNQICRCAWVEANQCPENMVRPGLSPDQRQAKEHTNAFVQLKKTVSCGK